MPDGEVIMADFGLVFGAARPGEGEGELLSKGLLRHRVVPGPVVDMLPISLCKDFRPNSRDSNRAVRHDTITIDVNSVRHPF